LSIKSGLPAGQHDPSVSVSPGPHVAHCGAHVQGLLPGTPRLGFEGSYPYFFIIVSQSTNVEQGFGSVMISAGTCFEDSLAGLEHSEPLGRYPAGHVPHTGSALGHFGPLPGLLHVDGGVGRYLRHGTVSIRGESLTQSFWPSSQKKPGGQHPPHPPSWTTYPGAHRMHLPTQPAGALAGHGMFLSYSTQLCFGSLEDGGLTTVVICFTAMHFSYAFFIRSPHIPVLSLHT